jgi:hypothetical protein
MKILGTEKYFYIYTASSHGVNPSLLLANLGTTPPTCVHNSLLSSVVDVPISDG